MDPAIEFKVLLVIKRQSDAYSPLFLPVRSRLAEMKMEIDLDPPSHAHTEPEIGKQ